MKQKCWQPKSCEKWGCYYHYKEDQCIDVKSITKNREEMVKFGHFVPTKEWEESRSTGEELEKKIKELY